MPNAAYYPSPPRRATGRTKVVNVVHAGHWCAAPALAVGWLAPVELETVARWHGVPAEQLPDIANARADIDEVWMRGRAKTYCRCEDEQHPQALKPSQLGNGGDAFRPEHARRGGVRLAS